jgi:hypothetical protein
MENKYENVNGIGRCEINDNNRDFLNQLPEYPQFVKMNGNSLRLRKNFNNHYEYYVDCGCWSIDFKVNDGVFYSKCDMTSLNNQLLTPITEAEWRKGQGTYAPKVLDIFGYLIENLNSNNLKYLLIKKTK